MRPPIFARIHRARSASATFAPLLAALLAASLSGCGKEEAAPVFRPNSGQIQVLNGSGRAGQVEVFRDHLATCGFDVIETGNARDWNHEHTLVVARSASDAIARDVARALGTDRVVHLQNPALLVEATVIIGKDYKELMKKWPQIATQFAAQKTR